MLWDEVKLGCGMQNVTTCSGGRKTWTRDEGKNNCNGK